MKISNFWTDKKILITGGRGFVGSHVVDNLLQKKKVPLNNLIIPDKKIDLRNPNDAKKIMRDIDLVLHLASDVGGIGYSSTHPATQMRNVVLIDTNVFEAAAQEKVQKLVCVSSAVAYPNNAPSPLKEEDLFMGEPAKGGYGYGFAKRMEVVLARAYKDERGLTSVVLISANSYGPRQDFDLKSGHVIPSLIRKCFERNKLEVWGDGSQIRDFFYVKDFAEVVVLAAEKLVSADPVNIGSGESVSIRDLVNLIVKLTKFKGEIYFDTKKPQGQKIRTVDISRAKKELGFKPSYSLDRGIRETIDWYNKNKSKL